MQVTRHALKGGRVTERTRVEESLPVRQRSIPEVGMHVWSACWRIEGSAQPWSSISLEQESLPTLKA